MNNSFNETEKVAVATVIFKLIGADGKYEKKELQYMHSLFINYDIPIIIPADSRIGYEKAVASIKDMNAENKHLVRTILQGLAECDSDLDDDEMLLIENILG